jgi:asparagine synthase (glutamine-hydrolysing)
MCGICGQYNFLNHETIDANVIRRMADSLSHRGPDDEGFYLNGDLGFGFRRLSIIDLGGGHQPMSDAEESVWVIFNGEIYNYPDLKTNLQQKGHCFRTNSDTEVIVHGYKEWGENVLHHLNGMFGLAIWDTSRKRLILARDRAGIKLLYYRLNSERIVFGSEARAILSINGEKAAVNIRALNLFLRYRYTPSPLTLFQGIQKLAPGTMLTIEEGKVRVARYWKTIPRPLDPMPTVEEAEEELLSLYRKAVRRQLLSDVPLGLLLSGGLDSGLLLALMSEHGSDWKTFSVGYGYANDADDELSDAAITANRFRAPNYSVTITQKDFETTLPEISRIVEEPVATSSVVAMYYVCKRAREDVKTVLIGQGPDELFGGYWRHLGVQYGRYWRMMPRSLQALLAAGLGMLPRNETIKRALYSVGELERLKRYERVFCILPGSIIDSLFRDRTVLGDSHNALGLCWGDLQPLVELVDELTGFSVLEIRSALPDELLMYGDKISMHHSLEARVPYLDHEIIEYAEKLDSSFKVRSGHGKWLHRRICERLLSPDIVQRKKRGFASTAVDRWFRTSLTGMMDSVFLDETSLMYEYLSPVPTVKLYEDHKRGDSNNYKILFSLLFFEQWLRTH